MYRIVSLIRPAVHDKAKLKCAASNKDSATHGGFGGKGEGSPSSTTPIGVIFKFKTVRRRAPPRSQHKKSARTLDSHNYMEIERARRCRGPVSCVSSLPDPAGHGGGTGRIGRSAGSPARVAVMSGVGISCGSLTREPQPVMLGENLPNSCMHIPRAFQI